jgi:hypothetical protein
MPAGFVDVPAIFVSFVACGVAIFVSSVVSVVVIAEHASV